MNDVLEISSDSSDTIILPLNNGNWSPKNSSTGTPFEFEGISKSFEYQEKVTNIDDEDDLPTFKRIRKSTEKSAFEPSEDARDILQKLKEKYKRTQESEETISSKPSSSSNYWEPRNQRKFERFATTSTLSSSCSFSSLQKDLMYKDDGEVLRELSQNSFSGDEDIAPQPSTSKAAQKKLEREAKRLEKLQERAKKKEDKGREKAIKQALATANKNIKPEECMKFITVQLEAELVEKHGNHITNVLQASDVKYEIKSQLIPNLITWSRQHQTQTLDINNKLSVYSEDVAASEALIIFEWDELVQHVYDESLNAHVESIQSALHDRKIFLIIFGLEAYFRYQKNKKNNHYRAQVTENETVRKTKDSKLFQNLPEVSWKAIERSLTELQLLHSYSYQRIETPADLGHAIFQYTKSIANLPFKQQKREKQQLTEWFAQGDNKDCVKVDKDGNGLQRLWNQILTTFPLAGLETAEAISSVYPSMSSLMKAYDDCTDQQEAEGLLKDIPIRRAAGPITSSRKIGPELSRKVYNYFNSLDGDGTL